MPSHRVERISEAIREVVAQTVLFESQDPRIQGVTVLRAEVSPDLRNASVYVSIMGTEVKRRQTLRALQHATGYMQAKVAARLQTRTTPVLKFKLDEGVRRSVEISQAIDQALAEDATRHAPPPPADPAQAPLVDPDDGQTFHDGDPDASR